MDRTIFNFVIIPTIMILINKVYGKNTISDVIKSTIHQFAIDKF